MRAFLQQMAKSAEPGREQGPLDPRRGQHAEGGCGRGWTGQWAGLPVVVCHGCSWPSWTTCDVAVAKQ